MLRFRIAALLTLLGLTLAARAQTTTFTYQGNLTESGLPPTELFDFEFRLFDASTGGSQQGSLLTRTAVGVTNGVFAVSLDFGNQFPGADRWLQIGVRTNGAASFTALAPRQAITPAPYAVRAANATMADTATLATGVRAGGVGTSALADQAVTSPKIADGSVTAADVDAASFNTTFWRTSGNPGTTVGTHFLGTTDNQPLEFTVNSMRALRIEPNPGGAPNLIGGAPANFVAGGAVAATIGGGGATNYQGFSATNSISADFGTIGGGGGNSIGPGALSSAIGGGYGNTISDFSQNATITGGYDNAIQRANFNSAIVGGTQNTIASNSVSGFIGAGEGNFISGTWNVLGGGRANSIIDAGSSTIGGGYENAINGAGQATVAGGWNNIISGNSQNATIGGGFGNTIAPLNNSATIAGGTGNAIQSNSSGSIIGGGNNNLIQPAALYATIGGGDGNAVAGNYGTVPGGTGNQAAGHSFAAGNNAKAVHDGSFVWSDAQNATFQSTAYNQFSVRASGGARFVTGGAGVALDGPLTVSNTAYAGGVTLNSGGTAAAYYLRSPDGEKGTLALAGAMGDFSTSASAGDVILRSTSTKLLLQSGSGAPALSIAANNFVGVGTPSPATTLHVVGGDATQLRLENRGNSSFWSIYSENFNNSGNLLFASGTGAYGYVRRSDGAFLSSSDRKLKKDITRLGGVLDRVMQLRPVSYRFRSEPGDAPRTLGLIAQEVEPLFPEAVGEHAGLKALAYSTLVPVTIGAIQELNQKLEHRLREKEHQIEQLERQNADLSRRLEAIERRLN